MDNNWQDMINKPKNNNEVKATGTSKTKKTGVLRPISARNKDKPEKYDFQKIKSVYGQNTPTNKINQNKPKKDDNVTQSIDFTENNSVTKYKEFNEKTAINNEKRSVSAMAARPESAMDKMKRKFSKPTLNLKEVEKKADSKAKLVEQKTPKKKESI